MSELLLFVYEGERTADEVLAELVAHDDELSQELWSTGVVRVSADGRLSVTATDRPGSGSPFWGVLWEALFGLVFTVPTAGSAYGANLGGLFGAIDRAGIDEHFRTRIRKALGPRSSGLAMLLHETDPAPLLERARVRPRTVLRTSLSLEQDTALREELGGITA